MERPEVISHKIHTVVCAPGDWQVRRVWDYAENAKPELKDMDFDGAERVCLCEDRPGYVHWRLKYK